MSPRAVDAVLFDLDETLHDRTGTLRSFLADQHERHAGRLGGATLERWRDRFLALDGRGHVRKSVVYPALLAELGGEVEAAGVLLSDYQLRCAHHARPSHGMTEVLRTLRLRGMALGIVTNGETDLQTRHIVTLGLDRLVDAVLVSEAEGLRKPDPALFHRAASKVGVEPGRCLFVGDDPVADVLGAADAGMKTAWLRCGRQWPPTARALPGAAIDHLTDLLPLIEVHCTQP